MNIIYNALIRVSRDPAAADRAVLSDLDRRWRKIHLPAYRRLVTDAQIEATTATSDRLVQLVDQLGKPGFTCGIWRSSAARHGRLRPA